MKEDIFLITTGDDFGASTAVNRAVIQAHREGILTSASIMAGGDAFAEAIALSMEYPRLSTGIHLTLARGKAVLPPSRLHRITDQKGNLPENPVYAGFLYFFSSEARAEMEMELEAQILKFMETGLTPTHLDGHLNMHVHPTVLFSVVRLARRYGIPAIRLPREPVGTALKIDRSRFASILLHGIIFRLLCTRAEKAISREGILITDRFFGLLAPGRLRADYLLELLDGLDPGVSEIGFHPALYTPPELRKWAPGYSYREELSALISRKVRDRIRERNIRLIGYRDYREVPLCSGS